MLWLVIISFGIGFIAYDAFRGEKRVKSTLASIDGDDVISYSEYYDELARTLKNYKDQMGGNFNKSMILQWQIPESVLNGMVNRLIVQKEAQKMNIDVSEDEIKSRILNYPNFQVKGKFMGVERFQAFLQYQGIDSRTFEDQIKNEILQEKLQLLVTASVIIDETTLQEKYRKEKDKVELDYISFNPERVKQALEAGDQELSEYYMANKNRFKSEEKRSGTIIAYNFDNFKKEIKVTEKEIYEYFQNNKANFIIPEKLKVSRILLKYDAATREEVFKKVDALRAELNKDNFADKAKEVSQDEKAQFGGDYGYNEWTNFTQQERTMIESMDEFSISTPIDAQQGFSILMITEKTPAQDPILNDHRNNILVNLEQEKLNNLVTEKLNKIYSTLEKNDNLETKTIDMGIKTVNTGFIRSGDVVKNVDEMGYISRRLFSMKENEIAFPVSYMRGIAIVQLNKIQTPGIEPFDKVKDKVKLQVINKKKVDLLKTEASLLSAELNSQTDPKKIEDLLKAKDLKSEPSTYSRGNRFLQFSNQKGLDDTMFTLAENRYSSPIAFDDRVIIVKAKKITVKTPTDFQNDRTEFYNQKIMENRNTFFRTYMSKKIDSYNINYNTELMEKIKKEVLPRF